MIYNQAEPQSADAMQRIKGLADKLNVTLIALPLKLIRRRPTGDPGTY
jgi:putative ABC transport system substrate-binding protein